MSLALLFVLLVAAAYRAWRFVALDDLPPVADVRARFELAVQQHFGVEWADGIMCVWCSGFWVSCAVVGITWAFVSLPLPGLWFLAVSGVVGLIGMKLEG